MFKYCFLSHDIKDTMPEYGKENRILKYKSVKSISRHDSCNIVSTEINSHLGTHIDCPNHFFNKAKSISDYAAEFWIFTRPFLLNLKVQENEIIKKEVFLSIPAQADIVLIKSGFQKFRGQKKYNLNNPGIAPEAALWLRENRPNIKVIGIDFISISPYQNRKIGRETHKVFLDPNGKNNPILILEDMDLKKANDKLSDVWVFPLRITFWDSSPCTIIGKIKN
ncbi:MAG: cyclase family protein [Candidatus Omnitrophica bacterium]|nr:cyclase family protein [Candidatus Omnitrophota bacterium]MDD5352383.1 cyclase family protein [Candidatus Omnitrophota bacterium]MDD5549981.1 cyclase family protein [Candidatus Omnitrophota bacterium]